jgi:hypothetical protein
MLGGYAARSALSFDIGSGAQAPQLALRRGRLQLLSEPLNQHPFDGVSPVPVEPASFAARFAAKS